MDEASDILTLFKSTTDITILDENLAKYQKNIADETISLKELKMNLNLLVRKRRAIETEIQKNLLIKNRNSDLYVKYNNTRLKLNKELIDDEIILERNEERIVELREAIRKGNELIENMKYFLHDKIFIEFVKGLGLEYQGNNAFRIKNYKNNEVVYLEDDENTRMKIWSLID